MCDEKGYRTLCQLLAAPPLKTTFGREFGENTFKVSCMSLAFFMSVEMTLSPATPRHLKPLTTDVPAGPMIGEIHAYLNDNVPTWTVMRQWIEEGNENRLTDDVLKLTKHRHQRVCSCGKTMSAGDCEVDRHEFSLQTWVIPH